MNFKIWKARCNSGLGLDSIEDNLTANIAASYQRELQAQNSVDFDDLLILSLIHI